MVPGPETGSPRTADEAASVVVHDLRVRYPSTGVVALDGVTFDLAPGEVVGLVGLNGAGKSTLCRCLNGIAPQLLAAEASGSVAVGGRDALRSTVQQMASVVGVVFDEPEWQLSQGTVGEEVALGLESMAVPYPEMVARVDDVLARVGLVGMVDRRPESLSGGEQQRLLLACALVVRPGVLVLDEPTCGLDPRSRAAIFDLLADVAERDGTAILVVEHDVELLAERADRILVLHEGRLAASGTPEVVFTDAAAMRAAGVRMPDVTEVALALDLRSGQPMPVTLDDGLRLLAGLG